MSEAVKNTQSGQCETVIEPWRHPIFNKLRLSWAQVIKFVSVLIHFSHRKKQALSSLQ